MGMLEDAIRAYAKFEDRTDDPETPSSGTALVYIKGGRLHTIDSDGEVTAYGTADLFDPVQDIDWHSAYFADDVDGVTDGGDLSQWDDSSGNGRHLTATGTNPKWRESVAAFNDRAVVDGEGAAHMITSSFSSVSQPWSLFVVARNLDAGTGAVAVGRNAADDMTGFTLTRQATADGSNPDEWRLFAGDPILWSGETPAQVISVSIADGSGSEIRINGEATPGETGDRAVARLRAFHGGDHEIAFYGFKDGSLTPGEIASLEQWASDYYGIALT